MSEPDFDLRVRRLLESYLQYQGATTEATIHGIKLASDVKLEEFVTEYRNVILKQDKKIEYLTEAASRWEKSTLASADVIKRHMTDVFDFKERPWYSRIWRALRKQWP